MIAPLDDDARKRIERGEATEADMLRLLVLYDATEAELERRAQATHRALVETWAEQRRRSIRFMSAAVSARKDGDETREARCAALATASEWAVEDTHKIADRLEEYATRSNVLRVAIGGNHG